MAGPRTGLVGGAALVACFPADVRDEAAIVVDRLPRAEHDPVGALTVAVDGEALAIPYRIYNPPASADGVVELSAVGRLVLHCLYTRHWDGFVRQRSVEALLGSTERWVVPFVLQLLGEYVVEIVQVIEERLAAIADEPALASAYRLFLDENPAFLRTTRERAVSYWNCYYRSRWFLGPASYPAVVVLDRLAALGPPPRTGCTPGAC